MGTFSEAIACPKVDLRARDPHEDMKFMGRKPECASFDCNVCGFDKEGGIPFRKVLETSEQTVEWTRYEDLERPGDTPLPNQLVSKSGKLCDLWTDFKKHSKVYMAHHAKAKWQTNCHGLCLRTFQDGDIVIETGLHRKVHSHAPSRPNRWEARDNYPHGGHRTLLPAGVGGRRKRTFERDMGVCFGGPCPRLRLSPPCADADR